MFKKLLNKITTPATVQASSVPVTSDSTYTIKVPSTAAIPNYGYSSIGAGYAGAVNIAGAAQVNSQGWITAAIGSGVGSFTVTPPSHIISLSKPSTSQEIVRLNLDGSVTWTNGIDIDAAAEAFGQSIQLSAEMKAGISRSVKLKMRDSVFEDLINIAKEKGSLTAEDLTYLLEASKIVEKLKGGN